MISGDRELGRKYRDLIIEQIKKELNPSKEKINRIENILNNSSSDELERIYEAYERFGVKVIMEEIRG